VLAYEQNLHDLRTESTLYTGSERTCVPVRVCFVNSPAGRTEAPKREFFTV